MKVEERSRHLKDGREICLRSPAAKDADAILNFVRKLHHESWENLNSPPEVFDARTAESEAVYLSDLEQNPARFMIVAFDGDFAIGNCMAARLPAFVSKHCGDIAIGTLKAYQGKGLGRMLMEELIEAAEKIGLWNLRLTVRDFNSPAIALYEHLGFQRVGTYRSIANLAGRFANEHIYQRIASPQ